MKAMRRILAVIAAMAMVLSLTPFAVFAADEGADDGSAVVSQVENEGGQEAEPEEADGAASDEAEPSDDAPEAEEEPSGEDVRGEVQAQDGETNVAQIGEAKYATLAAAAVSANDGNTITLLADAALTSTIEVNKNLTIDLNGHNITATDARALWIKSGEVTIIGTGTISTVVLSDTRLKNSSSVIRVGNNDSTKAKLTISSGVTVSTDYCYGVTVFGTNTNGIELVLDGTVSVTGQQAAISGNGNSGNKGAVTINASATVSATTDAAIYHPQNDALTINGGTITGPTAVYVKSGAVTINAGTLHGTGAAAAYSYNGDGCNATGDALVVDSCGYPGGAPVVTVSGGTFKSDHGTGIGSYVGSTATTPATVTASSNTITLPEGQMWVNNTTTGTYQIASAAAKVGDTKYATLAAAVEAAQNGDTITLLSDCNVGSARIEVDSKSYTVALNGHTLSSSEVDNIIFRVHNGKTITIDGTISGSKMIGSAMIPGGNEVGHIVVNGGTYENDSYTPFYANGNCNNQSTITINNATINATDSSNDSDAETGFGAYIAGPATVSFKATTINAAKTGIEIRAGSLTMNGACSVTANGSFSEAANGNGATVFGAAIAVSQHNTNLPISVTVNDGSYTGSYAIYEKDVVGTSGAENQITLAVKGGTYNGAVSSQNCTKFISGGTFSTAPAASLVADGCDTLQGTGSWSVVPSLHNFDYTKPDVRWRVINNEQGTNGEMVALFIYSCSCGETETVVVTPTIQENTPANGQRTYSASDQHGNTATLEKTMTYTVTLNDTPDSKTYQWGDVCSLDAEAVSTWYLGTGDSDKNPANMVADGTQRHIFAVTADTNLVTTASSFTVQQPVVRTTLEQNTTEHDKAVFNAKWSIPKGASVDSVTIYRGHTSSTTTTVSEDTLRKKGEKHTVYLKVWNGDYTLNLSGLTTGTYQHVMIEIVYTDSSGNSHTETSAVKAVQVT